MKQLKATLLLATLNLYYGKAIKKEVVSPGLG